MVALGSDARLRAVLGANPRTVITGVTLSAKNNLNNLGSLLCEEGNTSDATKAFRSTCL